MGQIINMIMRLLVRRGMQWGMRKGVDHLAKSRGGSAKAGSGQALAANRKNSQRLRHTMRMLRRIMR